MTAYAKDLVNPRTVRTLPNGDVLVVQSRAPEGKPLPRPKDVIRDWIMAMAKGGGGGPPKESNLITLLRDTNRDGKVDERHDLLDRPELALRRRSGTRARSTSPRPMRSWPIPIELGQTQITAAPTDADAASRRADQPSLDQGSGAQPGRALSLCLGRLQLERRGTRNRGREGPRRDLADRPRDGRRPPLRVRPAQPQRPDVPSRNRCPVDGRQRTGRARARTSCRIT